MGQLGQRGLLGRGGLTAAIAGLPAAAAGPESGDLDAPLPHRGRGHLHRPAWTIEDVPGYEEDAPAAGAQQIGRQAQPVSDMTDPSQIVDVPATADAGAVVDPAEATVADSPTGWPLLAEIFEAGNGTGWPARVGAHEPVADVPEWVRGLTVVLPHLAPDGVQALVG